MARFRKGTLDHDGDGRKGGSMAKAASKASAKKVARKPRQSAEDRARIAADAARMATTPDPQSGGVGLVSDEQPSAKAVIQARKQAVADQFAAADAAGDPAIAEATLNRQIRGW